MIREDIVGQRLDLAVMVLRPDLSRRTIKNLIIQGIITVNGKSPMANYKVKTNDDITIDSKEAKDYVYTSGEDFLIKPKRMKVEVIYEDAEIIVVNKPSGINSHPVMRNDNDSMLNGIYFHVTRQTKYDRNVRIRLVHRLDRDTSGVLLATKNLEVHDFYSREFEERHVKKSYYAIVKGDFKAYIEHKKQDSIFITSWIGPDKDDIRKFKNTDGQRGKTAKTHIFFESHFHKFGKNRFSVVRVEPETGRQHQIRVHLSSIRFPILGDVLYGGQKYKRLMLHAHKLTIKNMRAPKEMFEFQAALPDMFADLPGKKEYVPKENDFEGKDVKVSDDSLDDFVE